MRIEIELNLITGFNRSQFWFKKDAGYDEDLMVMAKWISFAIPGLFMRIVWRSK